MREAGAVQEWLQIVGQIIALEAFHPLANPPILGGRILPEVLMSINLHAAPFRDQLTKHLHQEGVESAHVVNLTERSVSRVPARSAAHRRRH